VNLTSLTKVLKCAKDDDICTLKAADEADVLNLVYEAKNSDRIAEYDMKLMDIDSDTLGIPETEYEARVTMPSAEFTRIVRDLSQLGESVRIEVSKEGVRFASEGESANGSVLLRQAEGAAVSGGKITAKKEGEDEDEGDGEEAEGSTSQKKNKKKVKQEKKDDDVEMNDEDKEDDADFNPKSDNEGEEEKDDEEANEDEDEDGSSKKRKKKANSESKPSKKPKTAKSKKGKSTEDDDEGIDGVVIEMNQHVSLTFSLKYLVNFSKSASLSSKVQLMMSNDVPLLVSYNFNVGHIHYYLAPKIGDD